MQKAAKGDDTRRHVLNTAMEILNTKGYAATSISDIIEATGVKKGNLYFHFASKEELAFAMIESARDEYNLYLSRSMKGANPLAQLYSIFDAIYRFHKHKNFTGGCLFGNMALELSDTSPRFRKLIDSVFTGWMKMFRKLYLDAQGQGLIKKHFSANELAAHTVALLEGAVMLSRSGADRSRFTACVSSLKKFLEAAAE
jgi:TetR/AcrR family transcriptional repressor of nem operon